MGEREKRSWKCPKDDCHFKKTSAKWLGIFYFGGYGEKRRGNAPRKIVTSRKLVQNGWEFFNLGWGYRR